MRCGVLCDLDGNVKRTWALISDTATVPVEDGDVVTEWEVDHGEELPHSLDKFNKIKEVVKEQERLPTLRVQAEVDAHVSAKGRNANIQKIVIVTPVHEPLYYGGGGKGLHHRIIDAEGETQEKPVDPGNHVRIITQPRYERSRR